MRDSDKKKEVFLSLLAHELRNPLAPIRNALQIFRIASQETPQLREAREMAERQLQTLTRMVDDLLDISRIMQGKIEIKRELVALQKIIERAVETVKPVLDLCEHRLETDIPSDPIWLHADPVRMSQVLSNLLHKRCKVY